MRTRVLLLCTWLIAAAAIACAAQNAINDAQQRSPLPVENSPNVVDNCAVSGVVLGTDGKPIRDARIELRDLNGRTRGSTYAQANGVFQFDNVPRGHYEVRVTSGLQGVQQDVDVENFITSVSLRIAAPNDGRGNSHSVSVTEMQVPDKARKALMKAEEAFGKHKLDEARKEVDKALQITPTYARALTLRGVLDLNDNHLDQAQQDLETAIRSDSGYGLAYVVLGSVYNTRSRFDDALRTLREGISRVPNSWQAYFESAKAMLGKGQYKESLKSIDQATQFVPGKYPPLHLVRAHALLGLRDYHDAIAELEQYLGSEPNGKDSERARQLLDQARAFTASNR